MGIWEFKNLFFVIVAVTLLSTGFTGMSSPVFADKGEKKHFKNNHDDTTPIINLGFLQLAAHDFLMLIDAIEYTLNVQLILKMANSI